MKYIALLSIIIVAAAFVYTRNTSTTDTSMASNESNHQGIEAARAEAARRNVNLETWTHVSVRVEGATTSVSFIEEGRSPDQLGGPGFQVDLNTEDNSVITSHFIK